MDGISSDNVSTDDSKPKSNKSLKRHNRSSSDQCKRDNSVKGSRNGFRAVNTVTGALNTFFKWTATPLGKQTKAYSVDSLQQPEVDQTTDQPHSTHTNMERRRSSNLIPKSSTPSLQDQREGTPEGSTSYDEDRLSQRESTHSVTFSFGENGSQNTNSAEVNSADSVPFPISRRSTDSSDGHRSSTEVGATDLREKAFEKSLNNILDKCSETSLDLTIESRDSKASIEDTPTSSKVGKSGEKKKKTSPWYTMISPTYKSRSEDFKKQFKDIPLDERLIVDYSCALQKEILVHGRMFVTQNWICFYANIFRWETIVTIPTKEISAITKEKTARVIPNAIQISTEKDKYFFTSFSARDKTFMMLFRLWQNALMDQPMSQRELWHWVHCSYGDELGLTSSDDDYVSPPNLEDLKDTIQKDEANMNKSNQDDDGESLLRRSSYTEADSRSASLKNDDDPTDYSDMTENSDGEVVCSGHDHLTKLAHNEVYFLTVDKMFELLFTDCQFFRQFYEARKLQDISLTPWQDDPDEKIGRMRVVNYTVPLNAPFGPKTSQTAEKQVCYTQSQPGMLYVIDGECTPMGIPYADAFYVVNRYCITRVSRDKSRLRVTSEVRYRKSVWGVMKNMIERNSVQGVLDYFQCLGTHLRRESDKNHTIQGHGKPAKRKLRKRRIHTTRAAITPSESIKSVRPTRQMSRQAEKLMAPPTPVRAAISAQKEEKLLKMNADTLVRIVCFILILLVMFNALLFYKLWSLETLANVLYFPHSHETMESFLKHPPKTQEEWVHLLKQQQYFHEAEMEKWKEILSTSISLVDQMRGTLSELKDYVDSRPVRVPANAYKEPGS